MSNRVYLYFFDVDGSFFFPSEDTFNFGKDTWEIKFRNLKCPQKEKQNKTATKIEKKCNNGHRQASDIL